MTGLTLLRGGAWVALGLGIVAVAGAAVAPVVPARSDLPPVGDSPRGTDVPARSTADSVAPPIVAHNLFRRSRRPAPPSPPTPAAAPPAAVARPTLRLVGVVAGAEPTAVIEGLPGVTGPRVLRPGEAIGAFRVRRITGTVVEVAGMDTVWVLTVRGPWHDRR